MADLAPLYLECLAARRPGLGGMAILLTLRQPETWLYSAWLENLCGTKLTQDFEPYAATFRGSGDLTAINQAVRKACPGVPVQTAWLEDTGPARQGPATPLPDAFALPEPLLASLSAPRRANPAIDAALIPACLALNRGAPDGVDLKSAKLALLAHPRQAQ